MRHDVGDACIDLVTKARKDRVAALRNSESNTFVIERSKVALRAAATHEQHHINVVTARKCV
jgi:hypothetical protein